MEIAGSARKHGVADEDIAHVVRQPLRAIDLGDRVLFIGADQGGTLLEVVVLFPEHAEPAAIHAMPLRAKFYGYLR